MSLSLAQRLTLAWAALAVLLLGLLRWLSPVLTPFLAAAILAYMLQPAVDRVARYAPRALAVVVVECLAVVLGLGVVLLIVPVVATQLPVLREQIPLLATRINEHLTPWLASYGVKVSLDIASVKAFVVKYLSTSGDDWWAPLLSSARIGGSFVLAIVGNLVLLPVVLFYLLLDWHTLTGRLCRLVPPRWLGTVQDFTQECDQVLGQYLRGQVMVMLTLALYYTLALRLGGLELALPVGMFTGLAVCVPYLGFGLGAVLALLTSVLQFNSAHGVALVAGVYGLGQVLESFVLTPRLVGERIGLHPLAVIFVLLAFGHLSGFVGVLLALPAGALGLVALRRLRRVYVNSRLYQG